MSRVFDMSDGRTNSGGPTSTRDMEIELSPETIARLIAASPDISPLCIERAGEQVEYLAGMARNWIVNGDEHHGAMLQCLTLAFGFQQTEIERLRVANANFRAGLREVEQWAVENEIAAPPLDWVCLGQILDHRLRRTKETGDG